MSIQTRIRLLKGRSSVSGWTLDHRSEPGTIRVGSGGRCDWRIEAVGVVPSHVLLQWTGRELLLHATGAGTVLVDGASLKSAAKVGSARVHFGEAELSIESNHGQGVCFLSPTDGRTVEMSVPISVDSEVSTIPLRSRRHDQPLLRTVLSGIEPAAFSSAMHTKASPAERSVRRAAAMPTVATHDLREPGLAQSSPSGALTLASAQLGALPPLPQSRLPPVPQSLTVAPQALPVIPAAGKGQFGAGHLLSTRIVQNGPAPMPPMPPSALPVHAMPAPPLMPPPPLANVAPRSKLRKRLASASPRTWLLAGGTLVALLCLSLIIARGGEPPNPSVAPPSNEPTVVAASAEATAPEPAVLPLHASKERAPLASSRSIDEPVDAELPDPVDDECAERRSEDRTTKRREGTKASSASCPASLEERAADLAIRGDDERALAAYRSLLQSRPGAEAVEYQAVIQILEERVRQ